MGRLNQEVILVVNERATKVRRGVAEVLHQEIIQGGYNVSGPWWVGNTESEMGLERVLTGHNGDEKRIVVAGGDGTVNSVVRKLWELDVLESGYVLVHAALGAFNVYNGTYSVEGKQVVSALKNPKRVRVDLQEIEAERVSRKIVRGVGLLGQGVGATYKIVEELERRRGDRKNWMKELKIVAAVVGSLEHQRPTTLTVTTGEGETYKGKSMFTEIFKGPKLLVFPVSNTRLDSGLMTGVVVPAESTREGMVRAGWAIAMAVMFKTLNPSLKRLAGVWQSLSSEFRVEAVDQPLDLHTDAELMGQDFVKISLKSHREKVVFCV